MIYDINMSWIQWCCKGLKVREQGQRQGLVNWSSRTRTRLSSRSTTLGYSEEWLTYWHIWVSNIWHQLLVSRILMYGGINRIYGLHVIIHNADCLQNAKSLTIFEDFVVQGQGQGLVNWSSRTRTFSRTTTLHRYAIFTQKRWLLYDSQIEYFSQNNVWADDKPNVISDVADRDFILELSGEHSW